MELTSTSTGAIDSTSWDLDGDGAYDDATGLDAQTSFPDPGPHHVGVSVKSAERAGPPPGDSHGHRPSGEPLLALLRTSRPPGRRSRCPPSRLGMITDYEWDLNGDGKYGDARGVERDDGVRHRR